MGKWDSYEVKDAPTENKWDKYAVSDTSVSPQGEFTPTSERVSTQPQHLINLKTNKQEAVNSATAEKILSDKTGLYDNLQNRLKLYGEVEKQGKSSQMASQAGEFAFNIKNKIPELEKSKEPQARQELANINLQLGRNKEAANEYTDLIAKNPQQPEYYQGIAASLDKLGRKDEAQAYLAKAQELGLGAEPPSLEQSEEARLRPMREEMQTTAAAQEALLQPYTAPIQSYESAFKSLKESAKKLKEGDKVGGLLDAVHGVIGAGIGAGMSGEGGFLFNLGAKGTELAGVPQEKIFSPVTEIFGDKNMGEKEKQIYSLLDLAAVGKALHAAGKTFTGYADLKEPPSKEALKQAAETLTPNEVTATLNNLDNPQAAQAQTKVLDLHDAVNSSAVPEDIKPKLQQQLVTAQDELNDHIQNGEKKNVDAAHDEVVNTKLKEYEDALANPNTPEIAKSEIQNSINQLKPKSDAIPKSSTEGVDVLQPSEDGEKVGEGNAKEETAKTQKEVKVVPSESLSVNPDTKDISTEPLSDDEKYALRQKVKEGDYAPVVVTESGKVLDGNNRLEAAQEEKVPVKTIPVPDNTTVEQAQAITKEFENKAIPEAAKETEGEPKPTTTNGKVQEKDAQRQKADEGVLTEPPPSPVEESTTPKTGMVGDNTQVTNREQANQFAKDNGFAGGALHLLNSFKKAFPDEYAKAKEKSTDGVAKVQDVDKTAMDEFLSGKKKAEPVGGKEIEPHKEVKASKTVAIKEVAPNYRLTEMEGGILHNLKNATPDELNNLDSGEGLKGAIGKKLIEKGFIDLADEPKQGGGYDYVLTDKAKQFIDAVDARLETRRGVKAGTDLFPEEANIAELKRKAKAEIAQGLDNIANKLGAKKNLLPEEQTKLYDDLKQIVENAVKLAHISIGEALQHVKDYIKQSDWYKNFAEEDKKHTDDVVANLEKDLTEKEEKPKSVDATSTKNAVVNAERLQEGKEPITKITAIDLDAIKEKVKEHLNNPKTYLSGDKNVNPRVLAKWSSENPHAPISAWQEALLGADRDRLNETRNLANTKAEEAKAAGNMDEYMAQRELYLEADNLLNVNAKANSYRGTQWSDIGRQRQQSIKEDYSADSLLNKYRVANNFEEIPPEIEKQLREQSEKISNLEKQLSEKQGKITEAETVVREQKIKAASREIANLIRKGKIARPDVFLSASPAAIVWDGALEIVAKTVEAGGTVAQAVADGLAHIKNSDWYKSNPDIQDKAEKAYSDFFSKKDAKIKAVEKRLETRLGKLVEQNKTGEYVKKEKAPPLTSPEIERLKNRIADEKKIADRVIQERYLKDRVWFKKMFDFLKDYQHLGVITSFKAIAKVATNVPVQFARNTVHDLLSIPLGLSPTLRTTPTFKGHVEAQMKSIAKRWSTLTSKDTWKDSWNAFLGKTTEMDRMAGEDKEDRSPYWKKQFDVLRKVLFSAGVGIHKALKTPVMKAEYDATLEKWNEASLQNGEDITSPEIIERNKNMALAKGLSVAFMQDNPVVKKWRLALSKVGDNQKAGASFPLEAGKFVAETINPVVKLPANYARDMFELETGLVQALGQAIHQSLPESFAGKGEGGGLKKMSQADKTMLTKRILKGSAGALLTWWGWNNYQNFGGYYNPHKKEEPEIPLGAIKIGNEIVGEHIVTKLLLHNPLYVIPQLAATARRVYEARHKAGTDVGSMALGQAAAGAMSEIPFLENTSKTVQAVSTSPKKAAINYGASFVPMFARNIYDYAFGSKKESNLTPEQQKKVDAAKAKAEAIKQTPEYKEKVKAAKEKKEEAQKKAKEARELRSGAGKQRIIDSILEGDLQ